MRRTLALGIALLLSGCCAPRAAILAIDDAWQLVGPEYSQFVSESRALSPESKATRLATARELNDLLVLLRGEPRR